MVRFAVFVAGLALLFASVQCFDDNLKNVKVEVVESLADYLKVNPDVKLLQRLEKEVQTKSSSPSPYILITYRLGNRINGDRLVATANGNQQWGTAQDVTLTLAYPRTGTGAVVTFIQIPVEQSSNLGQGYVTSGGIGQRQITVVIEAKSTLYFKYGAEIYGY